jgi:hypothetical protein
MIIYLKDPKGSTKKLLDLISTSGKIAEYKNNIQNLVDFLYTNNKKAEKEIRKTIPFIVD